MDEEYSALQIKLLFLGETGVGKTSLLIRYMDNKFEAGVPTVGIDVRYKYITYDNKKIRLDIWDSAGQERFSGLTDSYIRGANGIIFVYDKTNKQSFDKLKMVLMNTKQNISNEVEIMVVENKNDLEKKEITEKAVSDFEKKYNVKIYSTSAKSGDGVEKMYMDLIKNILKNKNIGKNNHDDDDEDKSRTQSIQLNKNSHMQTNNSSSNCNC